MSSVNKAILIGNVGKDPELRYTPSGAAVASFSLATSRKWTDKNGNKSEQTQWHNIVAWNKLAEIIGEYVKKGTKLYISGEIRYEKYEKDGETKYITKIVANEMQMLSSKNASSATVNRAPTQEPEQRGPVDPMTPSVGEDWDDDIPF